MTTATEYLRDEGLNLFVRHEFAGLAYSDGAEQQLLSAVSRATDRSTFSEELRKSIVDWPSEYHFSRERHCLIRPLGIKAGDRVLELGCGCGAITRFLGELGAEVTAVEGNPQRARIAAERCRGMCNVRVVSDNLLDFESLERFQWILLVGVLEYAPVFSEHKDPATHYLRSAARFLTDDGKLVVAIENKLGLKYFNGLAEDHFGTPFVGVQGLYGDNTPRTFGRRELERQIRDAGFAHSQFYYPFPDYKLPRVVLSEPAFVDELFNPADLLALCVPRDYARESARSFDDALVLRELANNGLLADLSNSLLVVASRQPLLRNRTDLAVTFSAARTREFATQTRFTRTPEGIQVIKEPLDALAAREATLNDGSKLTNLLGRAAYVEGQLQYWQLAVARAKQGGIREVVTALNSWFEYLLPHVIKAGSASENGCSGLRISGSFLDLTPFNLIESEEGMVAIDQEWTIDRNIPLAWLVTRSVLNSLRVKAGFEETAFDVRQVIHMLYADHGLAISESEIDDALKRERELKSHVTGQAQDEISRAETSDAQLPLHRIAVEQDIQIASLKDSLNERDGQIASLHNTIDDLKTTIADLNTGSRIKRILRRLT